MILDSRILRVIIYYFYNAVSQKHKEWPYVSVVSWSEFNIWPKISEMRYGIILFVNISIQAL